MKFKDGLINVLAQLGMAQDKAAHSQYEQNTTNYKELDDLYSSSWVAAAAVNRPVEDAMRKWRTWQGRAEDTDNITALEKSLGLKPKLERALKLQRLHGLSALYVGTNSKMLHLPLNENEVVDFLVVLKAEDFEPHEFDQNKLLAPEEPEFYKVDEQVVHESRLIVFGDIADPEIMLLAAYEAIRNADSIAANIASMVFEAKLDIFKIPDLIAQDEDLLMKRMTVANHGKSIVNAILMDSEEEHDQKQLNFTGLRELMLSTYQLVSGAVGIPASKLLGHSVNGLNAKGDNEVKDYDDLVQLIQSDIGEALQRLDGLLLNNAGVPDLVYIWEPLRSPTEKEVAEITRINAEVLQTLSNVDIFADDIVLDMAQDLLGERLPSVLDAKEVHRTYLNSEGF